MSSRSSIAIHVHPHSLSRPVLSCRSSGSVSFHTQVPTKGCLSPRRTPGPLRREPGKPRGCSGGARGEGSRSRREGRAAPPYPPRPADWAAGESRRAHLRRYKRRRGRYRAHCPPPARAQWGRLLLFFILIILIILSAEAAERGFSPPRPWPSSSRWAARRTWRWPRAMGHRLSPTGPSAAVPRVRGGHTREAAGRTFTPGRWASRRRAAASRAAMRRTASKPGWRAVRASSGRASWRGEPWARSRRSSARCGSASTRGSGGGCTTWTMPWTGCAPLSLMPTAPRWGNSPKSPPCSWPRTTSSCRRRLWRRCGGWWLIWTRARRWALRCPPPSTPSDSRPCTRSAAQPCPAAPRNALPSQEPPPPSANTVMTSLDFWLLFGFYSFFFFFFFALFFPLPSALASYHQLSLGFLFVCFS